MSKSKMQINNFSAKSAMVTIAVFVASIFGLLFLNAAAPFAQMEMGESALWLIYARNFFAIAILGFAVYLMYTYIRDYLELKSKFTLGIVFALLAFMLFALTSNPWFHQACGMSGGRPDALTTIPLIFATFALAILAWVSSK